MRSRLLSAAALLILALSGCASSPANTARHLDTTPAPDGSGVRSASSDPGPFGCAKKGSFEFFVPAQATSGDPKPRQASYARARAAVKAMGGNTMFLRFENRETTSGWTTADAYRCPEP